jgi:ribosomal protein S17
MKKITLLALLLTLSTQAETLQEFVSKQDTSKSITVQDINNTSTDKPYYQGTVVTVEQGGAYTYIEVKEKTEKTFWIAVSSSDAKVGDFVRFQKELVMKDFKSKALKKTFKELMFASSLQYRVAK